MAESLVNLVQWSTASYSIKEILDNYEARLPILALIRSIGVPPKSSHNLTNTEVIFVGQVLKIDSATEGQKRLIIEVVPQGLSLNIPLDCPAKFDIPQLKKKKLKLKKILSSPKYTLPLVAETSSKYSAYFEKSGAKATGDARRLTVKMVLKKVKDKERFLKTNFIHEGTESPLVTFISVDLPIELAVAESYIGQGTEERLKNKFQLTRSVAAKAKVNGKRNKHPPDVQLLIGAGLYIMVETRANNNYLVKPESSGVMPSRETAAAAAAAAAAAETSIAADDFDGIDMDDIDTEQQIALHSAQNSRVDNGTAATAEQEERETKREEAAEAEEKHEGDENIRQRDGDSSASLPKISDRVVSQRVDDDHDDEEATAVATEVEIEDEREPARDEAHEVNAKPEPVAQKSQSKQSSRSSIQSNPGQSRTEVTGQNSRSFVINKKLPEPEINHRGLVESVEGRTERHIYEEIGRHIETGERILDSKTNSFDDVSLESEEESIISPEELIYIERVDDESMQRNRIAQVAPIAQEFSRPTPMPRQSLRSNESVAQELVTEMNLGSTGVFCVELLPLNQLDSNNNGKLYNRGGGLRNEASFMDIEDGTSDERFLLKNVTRVDSRAAPTQRRTVVAKSVSNSDSLSISPRNDSGRAEQLENIFFINESFTSPLRHTQTRYAVGVNSNRSQRGTSIVAAADGADIVRTSTDGTQLHPFSWPPETLLSQGHSLDRRRTYQTTAIRLGSEDAEDANTQTIFYRSIDRRRMGEDSFAVDRRQSRTSRVQETLSDARHLPSTTSAMDAIHERNVRRNDSIVHRIILNDSDQATCKITSFTSTPSNDRTSGANISYRVPTFREEHESVPSIRTLPRKWTTSTPAVQTPRTSSSSNDRRHVVTVELPPYFEAANGISFSPESTLVRNQVMDAPSNGYVSGANQRNYYTKSTPDLAVKSDVRSRFQVATRTESEPLWSDASLPRRTQEIGYTIKINAHEDSRRGLSIDRRSRPRQGKGQEDFHQIERRAKTETVEDHAQVSPNQNVMLTTEGDSYKSRRTVGRSRTTASEDPRNPNAPGLRPRSKEDLLSGLDGRRPGNTSRTVERQRVTTRTRSLGNHTSNQRTEESRVRKGVLPERNNRRSGLEVTTTKRVRQLNENASSTQAQSHHFASNGKAADQQVLRHRSSNRITPEQRLNKHLGTTVRASHGHKEPKTLEEFDYCDSLLQSPNHEEKRTNYRVNEAESGRLIGRLQSPLRVKTLEKTSRPNYNVRTTEEFRPSNMLDRTPPAPVQNLRRRTQTSEKQKSSTARTSEHVNDAARKENGIHENKNKNRNKDRFRIQTPEDELMFTGNSKGSDSNDIIRTAPNENEKGTQKKPRLSHEHRDKAKTTEATATSGQNQNKQQNNSRHTTRDSKLQTPDSNQYPNSAASVATGHGVHRKFPGDLKEDSTYASPISRPAPKAFSHKIISPDQTASNGVDQIQQTKKSSRRRNKEIPGDQDLIYPVDMTVRETIRALDSFLKEQDPDAQSVASSQFTEHHELMIHHDPTSTNNF